MNGIEAWQALKERRTVTHLGGAVRAHEGMMQRQDIDGHWFDMDLNTILTSDDFKVVA